jgi:hypothetical protein
VQGLLDAPVNIIVSVGCGNPKGGAELQLSELSKFVSTVPPQE